MEEFQKSPCIYHPSEYITNFCKEKSCLMPLCPTCICSHLELHLKGGKSNPVFDNINESFSACSKEIKGYTETFEDGRNQLNAIQLNIIEQKKQLSELVYQTKVQVRELVEAAFDQLEKDLESAIDKQNVELGLHLPENLDTLQKGIMEIGSKLREMNGDLRTERSLSTLITFNHETRASLTQYQNDIFQEIKNNQQYLPVTSVNYDAINRLKQTVSQTILLKFNYPQAVRQQQVAHQQQTPQSVKTQPSQPLPHSPNPNPSFVKPSPLSDRGGLGSSLGTRPSAVTPQNKGGATSSSFNASGRIVEASGNSQSLNQGHYAVSQGTANGVYQGAPQIRDGRYKRSDIKVSGGIQAANQNN